jgi:hypothetical protein
MGTSSNEMMTNLMRTVRISTSISLVLVLALLCCTDDVDAQMRLVQRSNGTVIAAYKCIKGSSERVVGELCMAFFQLNARSEPINLVIRNLRYPQV